MKNLYRFLALILLGISYQSLGQQNVGVGTTAPDHSAILELQSSEKGLLIPRMSLTQRNSILKPANGLLVYQLDELRGFYFYDGTIWKPISQNDPKSVATMDINGWALDGNAASTAAKAAATSASFIGTPAGIPINFKIGGVKSGTIYSGENTFIGYQSGLNVTIPGGFEKGNTGFGFRTLAAVVPNEAASQGISNVALGTKALESNTTGSWNLGLGEHALKSNTTGYSNTAIGVRAMVSNVSGFRNLAIGAGALRSKTSGSENTAIGVNALENNLLGSSNVAIGYFAGQNEVGSNKLYISNSNTVNPLIKGEFDNKNLKINTGSTTSSTVGFLAIGNFDAGFSMPGSMSSTQNPYRLIVQDGIITEKVKVALKTTADWADYVFEPEYIRNIMSLEDLEKFTIKNKHLPNVPSAQAMKDNGLDVGETSKMFMEKIEELTIYMIELNKQIKTLRAENESLKQKK